MQSQQAALYIILAINNGHHTSAHADHVTSTDHSLKWDHDDDNLGNLLPLILSLK